MGTEEEKKLRPSVAQGPCPGKIGRGSGSLLLSRCHLPQCHRVPSASANYPLHFLTVLSHLEVCISLHSLLLGLAYLKGGQIIRLLKTQL